MKRIIKVNKHTAEAIQSLSFADFKAEHEAFIVIKEHPEAYVKCFDSHHEAHVLETDNYLFLYVPEK